MNLHDLFQWLCRAQYISNISDAVQKKAHSSHLHHFFTPTFQPLRSTSPKKTQLGALIGAIFYVDSRSDFFSTRKFRLVAVRIGDVDVYSNLKPQT